MPPSSLFPTKSLHSQFNKRNQTETKGGNGNKDDALPVILGVVLAALSLLVAVLAYRHQRHSPSLPSFFRRSSVGSDKASQADTLAATPQQDTPAAARQGDTRPTDPPPVTRAATPQQDTPAAARQRDTGPTDPPPDTRAATLQQDTRPADPPSDTRTAAPQRDTLPTNPPPDTPAPPPERDSSSANRQSDPPSANSQQDPPTAIPQPGPTITLPQRDLPAPSHSAGSNNPSQHIIANGSNNTDFGKITDAYKTTTNTSTTIHNGNIMVDTTTLPLHPFMKICDIHDID